MSSGVHGSSTNTSAPSQQQGLRKLKIFAKLLDTPPGVYTQYKPFLQKDKTVIRNLMAGVKKQRPAEVQSAILRRHLLELTQSFMIPLERYMASLMPLQKDISAFRSAPAPNHFKPDRFLATLEQSGPHLTSPLKGDWCGLYKRFFRSPNFRDWYECRYKELTQTLQHLQMQALSNAVSSIAVFRQSAQHSCHSNILKTFEFSESQALGERQARSRNCRYDTESETETRNL